MKIVIKSKSTLRFVTLIVLLFLLKPTYTSIADSNHWDNNWSFSQEIKIPFDTSLEIARFQPIDIEIDFQKPCWAKNNLEHSIRLVCWDGAKWNELESQIYSLKASNENFIMSCNIVFLIPNFADGTEEYYVYYDDSEKPAPDYFDHVQIEDSYYRYEPIPGYPLESSYYKITDDDYIPYVVSYEGQLMGYNTGQHVTKMKDETVEVLPKNGEIFAAFDFKYTYEKSLFGYSSTSQKVISKEVLVDGNLMLEFRITSTSKFNDLQTTGIYKYYHCPSSNTRVHVHIKHETLKEIDVCPIPPATNTDGVFVSMQSGGVKSKSISELNIGQILPFLHFSNEKDTISEYKLDIDPEYISEGDLETRVISIYDDIDLGENAWFSYDYGETDRSHSVIFYTNSILVSGNNEQDGLQLNAFEIDYPHMPGFENNVATVQVGRNSFETGGSHDLKIPDDFIVEFDAEFFSSKIGGFSIIDEEAAIYRELVKIKPRSQEEFIEDSDEIEKHDLSVFVHFASRTPMGSSLSALLGINLPYISVELYKDDDFIYSKNAERLPINPLPEIEELSFFEKIISILKIFDIKNISFFKKAVFPEIEGGKYVIKIYRENMFFSKQRQYIGYAIVDLQQDEKIHVLCRSEATIKVKIVDQNNKMVKNAEVVLQKDDTNIAKHITDENGQATIKAPTSFEAYDFKVIYNGCIIHQELVKLGFIERIIPLEKTINIQRHNLVLIVTDTWGQIPEIELNPIMTIEHTDNPIRIRGQKFEDDKYIFTDLTPAIYQLSLTFKSFNLNNKIEISEDKKLKLEFPAEYDVKLQVIDARGIPYRNSRIVITRNNEKLEIQNQESELIVTIPPGDYQIEIFSDDELIGVRNIGVYGEQKYDLITKYQSNYPIIIIIVGFLLIIFSLIVTYYKKDIKYFFISLTIFLILISFCLPWWEINGSTNYLQTSTKLYIIPNNMITLTSTKNTIAGEPSFLPDEFQQAIFLMIIIALGGCFLLILKQIFKKINKKRLCQISKIFSVLSLIIPLLIFIIAMSELSKVSIGTIFGNGYLDVGVPGESSIHSVLCTWGPSIGFYIYLIAIVFLLMTFSVIFFIKKGEEKNER